MKPVASTMAEVDTLEGEEVKFSISTANSAWVMRSMADLYSNRELAVIREYSTNAFDSNKEKALADGTEIEPIEVTLPNALNPYFAVQDYGVGMTATELKEVYTLFGESTKRESDEYNGMLGFGCKSAVAYTNTFTVTAVKDGQKTVGVITRREDAMGGYLVTLKIVLEVKTSERNGVHIQVPVHNWVEFEQKGRDFYRYWKPGTVRVNGKEPEWAVGEKIDDELYYNANNGASYVVMGNVPYQINNPEALFPKGMNRISFVAYVPLGAVEFVPSREALKYSEHTKKNLHKIINDFVAKSTQLAKDEIAGATTHYEAYKLWDKWRSVIGANSVADLTFKGDKLVDRFPLMGARWNTQQSRYATQGIREWSVAQQNNTLIVYGFPSIDNLNANQKAKAKGWRDLKGMQAQFIVFTENTSIDTPWVDPARVVQWEKVKAEAPKPPKKPRAISPNAGRLAGSFDLISSKGRQYEKDVPQTKELFYIMVKEFNNHEDRRSFARILTEFKIDHDIVLLPANRKDKFLRFYPHAKPIIPVLEAKINFDGPSMVPEDAITYLRMSNRGFLTVLNENNILDPVLKKRIIIAKKNIDELMKEYRSQLDLAIMLGKRDKFKTHNYGQYDDKNRYNPVEAYPLYTSHYSVNVSHVELYINAVYAARKDGKIG